MTSPSIAAHPLFSGAMAILAPDAHTDLHTWNPSRFDHPYDETLPLHAVVTSSSKVDIDIKAITGVKKNGVLRGLQVSYLDPATQSEVEERFLWISGRDELFTRLSGSYLEDIHKFQLTKRPPQHVHYSLTIKSSVRLSSALDAAGHDGRALILKYWRNRLSSSLLGFGVYRNTQRAKESVLEAFRAGYRHVDSAQTYRNEVDVGDAVRESVSGAVGELYFGDGATVDCSYQIGSSSHGYANTVRGVDESLKRFKFDYVDLFLIHDPLSGKAKRLETYKALLEAKQAGKIRSVGVSNYGVHHLEEIKGAGYEKPSVNQIEQKPIVKYCQENSIVVEAYCPLIEGRMDHPVIQEIAKKSATPSRIRSNADVFSFELSKEDMDKLDGLDKGSDGAVSWNPVDAA
ncbi:hypothetical protein D9611_014731 [Ephemerocybe angulata]|uniref:NADP-dependent oxidoreductase domain-containing protein n=1 Tax=Ephemerocybe angulata TaxID=980116 RepID=A0A8H5B749_9AGAR|nr:hypothetical protein D9611_014731 [Tulosesus angulatus]